MRPLVPDNPRRATDSTIRILTEGLGLLAPGDGALLVVTGPPGSGKSRLVEDLIPSLSGWTTVRASALPWRSQVSGSVAHLLLDQVKSAEESPLAAFDTPETSALLVVEDAHHADERSLQLLVEAAKEARHGRIAVLVTTLDSSDGVGQPSMTQLREMADTAIGMPPYSVDDVRAFAISHVGAHLSPATATQVRAMTGGRPGRIRELFDAAANDHWRRPNPSLPVPETWSSAFHARAGSHPHLDRVLSAVATIVDPSGGDPDKIATVAGDQGGEELSAAFDAGLLTLRMQDGHNVVAFTHPTDRSVVRSRTSPAVAAELHRAAAGYHRDNRNEDSALMHEAQAARGANDEVADALNDRADALAVAGHWHQASAMYRLSAQVTSDEATTRDRRLAGVEAMISASDIPRARRHAAAFTHLTDDARVHAIRGYLAVHDGRRSEAIDQIERAWSTLDRQSSTDPELRALVASRHVMLSLAEWQPEQLVAWAATTDKWAPPGSPVRIDARYISMIGQAAATGRPANEVTYPDETPELSQRRDMAAGWIALAHDDPITSRQRLLKTSETQGSERINIWVDARLARTHLILGDLQDAQRAVERGLARAEHFGVRFLEPMLLTTGIFVATLRGNNALINSYAQRLTLDADALMIQRIPSAIGQLRLATSRNEQSHAMLAGEELYAMSQETDIGQPGFWPWEHMWAPRLLVAGRDDDAEQLIVPALERAENVGVDSVRGRLMIAHANLKLHRGQTNDALRQFEDAADLMQSVPMPALEADALYEYGRTLRRLGRRRRADEVLSRAGDIYAAMGATEFVERCQRERRAGGLGTRKQATGELTPQEREIARFVATGATNQEVAREMFISTKTVEYHLTRVYRKLGIRTRTELPGVINQVGGR